MIWIRLEHPKRLTAVFRNLAEVSISGIIPECDLSRTLFILEAAPALHKFTLSRERHACAIPSEDSAEKTNVEWEPSKDLKHLNLKLLRMYGFEDEDKVTNYIRLVMERAVRLKRIELRGEVPCEKCDAIYPRRSQVDKGRRRRIKERLTHESSSAVGMIMLVAAMPAQ
uniref:FBD domain-containing protein n=2 Tax=Triticum aestivum TaxID=4565 RepID=A0A3B5ZNM8_WHEAT